MEKVRERQWHVMGVHLLEHVTMHSVPDSAVRRADPTGSGFQWWQSTNGKLGYQSVRTSLVLKRKEWH